jgi:hypothetical protein
MSNITDHDDRESWAFVVDVLDAFERHGYRKGDDQHTGHAIAFLAPLARIHAGEADTLEADAPGIQQPGEGWISGACFPAGPSPAAPADRMST